jgi:putative ABC transport system permease protein
VNVASLAVAWARRRPFATLLNVALLAVGIATMTLVLLVTLELEQRMQRDARGIDLVVGAKGSPLQLVLAGVFHVDVPPGNVPLAAVEALARNPLVQSVLPLSLGDSYRGHRIVGTEPALVGHYGAKLREGRLWQRPLEAVLGSEAARATGLAVGGSFAGSHGLGAAGAEHGEAKFAVVGVLAPTGTVVDRLILTSLQSVWDVHEAHHPDPADHPAEPAARGGAAPGAAAAAHGAHDDHADETGREVTLALIRYASPIAAASLPRAINADTVLQAASPAQESARLLTVFGVGTDVLRGFGWLLVAASALGLLVALTQAMDERRGDIAIMRVLGASRTRVVGVLLVEGLLLTATGALIGIGAAHALVAGIGAWLPEAASLAAGAARWHPAEVGIVAVALVAGIIAAMVPAWRAYRLDVAAALAED